MDQVKVGSDITALARVEFGRRIAADEIDKPEWKELCWRPSEMQLQKHLILFGGTRFGKSKLFEQICRELVLNGSGFAFIDPHSDTADDLLSYMAFHHDELGGIARRVHYLNPTTRLFSFDPFRYRPDPDVEGAETEGAYQGWLYNKTKHMAGIIVRKQGETEAEAQRMVRLRRWLGSALYAAGIRQDETGAHEPLPNALVLLRPNHPRHSEVYGRVEPFLTGDIGEEVQTDLEMLRKTQSRRQQEDWVESAINRLREILSPTVRKIFSLQAPSIDFHDIIRRGDVILASLGARSQPTFDAEEGQVIAGLLIREISEAARTADRSKRKQFYLFMDEAQNFIGEDLMHLLTGSAKFRLSVGMAVQSPDLLRKGDIDLLPSVLGMCGVRITFRQKHHKEAEILAKDLGSSLLDFTKLIHTVERHGGYEWVATPTVTEGTSWSEVNTHGGGTSRNEAKSSGGSTGVSENESTSEISDWMSRKMQQLSNASSAGLTKGTFDSATIGATFSTFTSQSRMKGGSYSISWSLTPLATPQNEEQDTGRLVTSTDDQHAKITNMIMHLPQQFCFVAVDEDDAAFVIRVSDVVDPFKRAQKTEQTRKRTIAELQSRIFEKPYFFIPKSNEQSDDASVQAPDNPFFFEE